ncbi:MAG: PHP domain-containing protein, partial [Patescibacteria group bacterium]
FREGKVRHFEEAFVGIHKSIFEFLKIPGIGPKTAQRLSEAGVKSVDDLEEKIKKGKLLDKDFSEKILQKILQGIGEYKRKSDRILLPVAQNSAQEIIAYLQDFSKVKRADTLGSLRRMVATVGDIDLSAASEDPEAVVKHFCNYSGVERVIESGERTATVLLKIGQRVDLTVQPPESYGNLLQHLTGSKNHNIKLRSLARDNGLSMSEYGITDLKTKKVHKFESEEKVYKLLGLPYIEPELREDTGEIEAAAKNKLPKLIELSAIKGDLHTHTFWTDGKNSVSEMAQRALELGREYIALTDHSYPTLQYDKRNNQIEQYNYSQSKIRVIKGLEVNINVDATLQIPDDVLSKHELNWVSIHTSFRQSEKEMTERIIKALENKYVTGMAHPTGRILLEREGIEADWGKIFKFASDNGKIIEINSFPNRTDL